MRHIKAFGVALATAIVVSAVVSSAAAALEFLASGATGLLLGKLIGGPHTFTTETGIIECEVANASGTISATGTEVQLVSVTNESCKVSGLGLPAVFTRADYLFNANGTVKLDNLVKVNEGSGVCVINFEPQSFGGIVKYDNITGPPMEIDVLAQFSGMAYEAVGALCPKKGKFSDGSYKGNWQFKEDGGEYLVD